MNNLNEIDCPNEPFLCRNFVGGNWVEGNGKRLDVYSPIYGKVVGIINESTESDVEDTVRHAQNAFKIWKDTPLKERCSIMFKFRELLLRDIDKISKIVSLENGKTFSESKAGILKGIEVLEFAISLQNLDEGAKMEVSRGVFCEYRREPLGVVASITPFNFPAMVPMWTIPIAITLGNCYVWKPSEKTPITSLFIANTLKEAGLPDGVLSIVQGSKTAVESLIDHPDVKAVAFVGSSKIANLVYERSAKNGKRALALGGAKNHIFLLPDADPNMCGRGISDSFTGCAGQRCMAASVLLAIGDCDQQIEKIIERAKSLELGKDMGAIITKEQVNFLNSKIEEAVSKGAKLLLDGRNVKAPEGMEQGYWLGPTILDNVSADSDAAKVELFGPVLSIVRCKNISEAIEVENSCTYGNAASVFTSSGALSEKIIQNASAGMVGVNIGVPVPREPFSFGGINVSKFGYGDITGKNSLNFWTNQKKVTVKWEMQKDHNWMS